MGSLAWRTFCGCFMSRQALPFVEDDDCFQRAPTREVGGGEGKREGALTGAPGGLQAPIFLSQPFPEDPALRWPAG